MVFRNPISRQLTEENHLPALKPIKHINQSIPQEGKDHEQKAETADFGLLQHHRQIYPQQDTFQCASDCIHQRKRQIPVACVGTEKPVQSRGKADRQSWNSHCEG